MLKLSYRSLTQALVYEFVKMFVSLEEPEELALSTCVDGNVDGLWFLLPVYVDGTSLCPLYHVKVMDPASRFLYLY